MSPRITIVGGGLSGMTLALALTRMGFSVRVFEARSRHDVLQDRRILALSEASCEFLARFIDWRALAATPIESVHVSQAGHFGRFLLSAQELGLRALGHVVAAGDLAAALSQRIDAAGIDYIEHGVYAPGAGDSLVIHAEGHVADDVEALRRDYRQSALVCRLEVESARNGRAWERFTPQGPIALLPDRDAFAAIIIRAHAEATALCALPERDFMRTIEAQMGGRLRITSVGERLAYPLRLAMRQNPIGARSVWIGNAAQTLHPVGGQGFNLALRDIAVLADTLAGAPDPGCDRLLARYALRRDLDRRATVAFTDAVARLFLGDFPPFSQLRGGALFALDLCPRLRRFLARRLIYGARAF
ncbi:MAG: NAD(P)-binding protein [Rhodocyclaceae bacterium]|nr:NAD(P)-binding protein [Rhodocyclaceae bacterium]